MTLAAIARLDASLERSGVDVTLRRPGTPNVDAACRAHVRALRADPLTPSIRQADSRVILSPTDIDAAEWPGALATPSATQRDNRLPRKGDLILHNGAVLAITDDAIGFFSGGVLVRIEVNVRG